MAKGLQNAPKKNNFYETFLKLRREEAEDRDKTYKNE